MKRFLDFFAYWGEVAHEYDYYLEDEELLCFSVKASKERRTGMIRQASSRLYNLLPKGLQRGATSFKLESGNAPPSDYLEENRAERAVLREKIRTGHTSSRPSVAEELAVPAPVLVPVPAPVVQKGHESGRVTVDEPLD